MAIRSPHIKMIGKYSLILTAVLLGLIIAALAGIQVFMGTDAAGRLIRERINTAISGSVDWKGQHLSLARGRLEIHDFRVKGAEGETIIRAERAMADIGLLDLVSGVIRVEEALLESPAVYLETGEEGRLNVAEAFQPTAPGPPREKTEGEFPFRVLVDAFFLKAGAFSYSSAENGEKERIEVLLEPIRLTLREANLGARSGRLSLTVSGGRIHAAGVQTPIERIRIAGRLAKERLDLSAIEVKIPDAKLEASGAVASILEKPELSVDLSLAGDLSGLRRMARLDTELSGDLIADIKASGALANPYIALDLSWEDGAAAGVDISSLALESRMENRKVSIVKLDAGLSYGDFFSSGSVNLQEAFPDGFFEPPQSLDRISYAYDLAGENIRLERLSGKESGLSGGLSAQVSLQGEGVRPQDLKAGAEVSVKGSGIETKAYPKPLDADLSGRLLLEDGIARINGLELSAPPAASLRLAGSYRLKDGRIDLSTDVSVERLEAALAPFPAASGVKGGIFLHAKASGPVSSLSASGRLNGRALAYRAYDIGDIETEIAFAKGRLEIPSFLLSNDESRLSLSGDILLVDPETGAMRESPFIDFSVKQSRLHIGDFLPDYAGEVDVSGSFSGPPGDLEGAFTLDGRDLETGVQPIPALHLSGRIKEGRIHLSPLTVSLSPSADVRAEGWVSLDGTYELRMASDPVAFQSLAPLKGRGLAGQIEVAAQGSGSFARPQVAADFSITGLSTAGKALPDMTAHIRLEDQVLYVDSNRPVAIDARLGLKNLEYRASARFSETELSPYFALAGMNDLSGILSAHLEASGNVRNTRRMQAEISIANLVVRRGDLLLASAQGLEGAFENGTLNFSEARISLLEEGYIELSAETGLDGNIDVAAAGQIPFQVLDGFLPRIQEPVGVIALEAEVAGPVSGPSVSARVSLEDIGFTVSETLQKVNGVSGTIDITEDAAMIENLDGGLGEGEFSLAGRMELAQFSPQRAEFNLNARALPLVVPDIVEVQVNLDLAFSGTPSESRLEGDVVLLEGEYSKDINLSLIDTASRIGERGRETEPISPGQDLDVPFLRNLTLDLSLSSRQAFLVDNNLALMRIRPTLRIEGTLEAPSVTGRAEVREGTITYRSTEFEIEKGVIDFVNPYRIEPTIDIAAEADVRKWVITLLVSGTPDNLDFRLRSDPPESDADIISLLAVGKTTGELTAGGGATGRSPEEMLANVVAGRLAERVKEGTGLDIVEFEYRGEQEGEDGSEGVRVMVGKELSRRLTVKYGVERKSGVVVQQSTAAYKLLENLAVNAYQDTEGTFGGEVRYRLEFR